MSRYLDPKADVVFKKIFGDHPHILISFLNAVLPLPVDSPIVELSYWFCRKNIAILVQYGQFLLTGALMISFKWKHFPKDVILMSVRWYLAYSLSYRDIEEMMLERGVKLDHSVVNRWVLEYAPQLEEEFIKNRKKKINSSWRMDETYIKLKGEWHYLYRAVDKFGDTVDFMLSKNRDKRAATAFFEKAIDLHGLPEKVTMDKSGANKAGIDAINFQLILCFLWGLSLMQITVRQIKYLNNIVEQDHRSIKKITNPMKGFKAFYSAQATLAGIELHHMLRKGQHINAANQSIFEQFYALAG